MFEEEVVGYTLQDSWRRLGCCPVWAEPFALASSGRDVMWEARGLLGNWGIKHSALMADIRYVRKQEPFRL